MSDLVSYIIRQREFSERTFGPGARLKGVIAHIRSELLELEADPTDLKEWVDVIILALDGAWRAGYDPEQIVDALDAKQAVNIARKWPDWRKIPEDHAIEHLREHDVPAPVLRQVEALHKLVDEAQAGGFYVDAAPDADGVAGDDGAIPGTDADRCPRCGGSFEATGGTPVEGALHVCQRCYADSHYVDDPHIS